MEQTIQAGNNVRIIVNVVDSSGAHVAATINTSTTRLQKGNTSDTTWNSATPTVETIATGVYRINFSSLSPAVSVADNDDLLRVAINGDIGGTAWTEYHLPLRCEVNNTSLANIEDAGDNYSATRGLSGTALPNAAAGASGGLPTDSTGKTAFNDVTAAAVRSEIDSNSTQLAAIVQDTGIDIPLSISNLNDLSSTDVSSAVWNAATASYGTAGSYGLLIETNLDAAVSSVGGDDAATIWSYATRVLTANTNFNDLDAAGVRAAVGLASANLDTQLSTIDTNVDSVLVDTGTDIPASISALNDLSTTDVSGAVWNAATASYGSAGSYGLLIETNLDAQVSTVGGGDSAATIYSYFTSGSNEDAFKADVSSLATSAAISALNDISAADVWSYATRTITSGGITASEVTDAVWDASVASHNTVGSFGKAFRQVKEGLVSIDGQVNDLSATSTSFITNLATAVDDYYNGQTLHFISGSLAGQSQVIRDYDGATKTITLDSALTSAPSDTDEFIVLSTHVHTMLEIEAAVNAEVLDVLTTDTFGEPTGVPLETASINYKLGTLYKSLINQITVTATKKTFHTTAGVADWEKDLSDTGTTYTETKGNAV